MPRSDTAGFAPGNGEAEKPLGRYVFHAALPGAIRSLDDEELRTLLVALLWEWRGRTEAACQHSRR